MNKGESDVAKRILLDLDKGTLVDNSELLDKVNWGTRDSLFFSNETADYYAEKILENNKRGYLMNLVQPVNSEVKNWRLAKDYPKDFDILSQKRAYLYGLSDTFKNPVLISEVYSLLSPKTNDLFGQLTIRKGYSNDRQEHVIHSYQEFEQYYRWIPKEEKK